MKKIHTLGLLVALVAVGAGGVAVAGTGDNQVPPQGDKEKTALLDSFGMSAADAQPAFRTPSGRQLYVNRTDREVCLTDKDGSGHCAPRDRLAAGLGFGGELCVSDLPADEVRITGVLPTGADQVALKTADGSTFRADAVNDSVAFEVPRQAVGDGQPVQVTWSTAAGDAHTMSVRQPPIVASARC